MSKRTNYKNMAPKDLWPTIDPRAVTPLIPFVGGKSYAEPCSGHGDLINLLKGVAICQWSSDIIPRSRVIYGIDAADLYKDDLRYCDCIITNPPFTWKLLQPLLEHLPTLKPTWLLLPADSMHTKRMGPYMKDAKSVVSIGRLKWFKDDDPRLWDEEKQAFKKNTDPTDNFVWMEFIRGWDHGTRFYGR